MSTPLLERDMLLLDPWDAIKSDKLVDQGMLKFRKTAGIGVTLQIYGHIAISDLTGRPVIEDMKVMLGDADIYDALPDSLLTELEEAAIQEAA